MKVLTEYDFIDMILYPEKWDTYINSKLDYVKKYDIYLRDKDKKEYEVEDLTNYNEDNIAEIVSIIIGSINGGVYNDVINIDENDEWLQIPYNFKITYDPCPPMKNSYIGFNINSKRTIRIGMIGDGNCMLHSIYHIYEEYIEVSDRIRRRFVETERRELYNNFTKEVWETMNNGKVKEASEIDPSFSYRTLKTILRERCTYLGDEFIDFIGNELQLNIIMIQIFNGNLSRYGNFIPEFHRDRETIIILFRKEHYEGIGVIEKDIKVIFKPGDKDLDKFLEII